MGGIEVGRIVGTTSLKRYLFAISPEGERYVRKDEFVSAVEPVTGKEIIGIIKGITVTNQLLPDEFARESAKLGEFMDIYDFGEGEYLLGIVHVLGYLDNEGGDGFRGLEVSKYSLRPATVVTLTSDEDLKRLLDIDPRVALHIGTIESRPKVDVFLDCNKLVSTHLAILAMTGGGKSYTAGVLIEEILKKKGAIIVLDPHGEYKYLGYNEDGTKSSIFDRVKVYGVGSAQEDQTPLKIKANKLSPRDYYALIPGLSESQEQALYDIIKITKDMRFDYNLADVIEVINMVLEQKDLKEGKGEAELEQIIGSDRLADKIDKISKKAHKGVLSALLRRLEYLKRSKIIGSEETLLEDMIKPNQVSIIDMSGTQENIKELVASAIARKIFNARVNHLNGYGTGEQLKTPCLLVVEEAHGFIPRESDSRVVSKPILRRIAREGRKFGIGLCLISQRPSRLDQDALSQCNTQIIMRVMNPVDQEHIRKSAEAVTEDIIQDLPSLTRGEAIVTGNAINFPMHVKIKQRSTKPGGSDIDIVSMWGS